MSAPQVVVTSLGHCVPADVAERLRQHPPPSAWAARTSAIDAAEMDARLGRHVPPAELRRLDRLTRSALLAALDCMRDSGLTVTDENAATVGCVFNTVYGPLSVFQEFIASGLSSPSGLAGASALLFPYTVMNAASGVITGRLGATGFSTTLAGYSPVCYGFDAIRSGRAAALLTGGFDELTEDLAEAQGVSVPHLTEASAMALLEDGDAARAGGRSPLFRLLGYAVGASLPASPAVDNYADVEPQVLARAIARAYEAAGRDPERTGLVVCFGRGDAEKEAERAVLDGVWTKGRRPRLLYPRDVLGDAFAANDLLVFPLLRRFLAAQPADDDGGALDVLINQVQVGGNLTSLLVQPAAEPAAR